MLESSLSIVQSRTASFILELPEPTTMAGPKASTIQPILISKPTSLELRTSTGILESSLSIVQSTLNMEHSPSISMEPELTTMEVPKPTSILTTLELKSSTLMPTPTEQPSTMGSVSPENTPSPPEASPPLPPSTG